MQAQDYAMSKWAVGVRCRNSTEADVEAAMDKGDIIRTHVLRRTWQLVSADDLRWMSQLTVPQIKGGMKTRFHELGLTQAVLAKSRKVLEKTLRDGNHSTREELIAELNRVNIDTNENRASHLFVAAELDGLICSGAEKSGKPTYALLDERVPKTKLLGRDEGLALLARRYFASRGPAALDDFTWWSGLSVNDAKRALEAVKPDLLFESIGGKTYWFSESKVRVKDAVVLLPAFDEFLISYKDRSATITLQGFNRAVSSNGMFHPILVIHGETLGVWKRVIKKDKAILDIEYFKQLDSTVNKLIEAAAVRYGRFLGKNIELH